MPADSHAVPDTLVISSLKALLHEIIDYAGLFPPAGLSLDEALPSFARYRTGPDAWMLARFIIPANRLDDLKAYADRFAKNPPFRFSVLGSGGDSTAAFLDALAADLRTIHAFHRRHPQQVRVEAVEVRLPTALLGATEETLAAFLHAIGQRIDQALPGLRLFLEVPLDKRLLQNAPPLLDAISSFNVKRSGPIGFKMRTGGLDASAFPSAEHLAFALTTSRDAGVPFKATAGLHHPACAYRESVQASMYGFFNVFGGAVLAAVHTLDETTLRTILLDEDADHFRFTDDAFYWKDLAAPVDAIRRARETFALSFGSCSFDEPRDDLRALGLL